MKRMIMVLLLVSMFTGSIFALDFSSASPAIDGAQYFLDVGIGIGLPPYAVKIPTISAAFTTMLDAVPMSIGGYVGFTSYGETKDDNRTYSGRMYAIGARANWHYTLTETLDTYIGISLGYLNWSEEFDPPLSMGSMDIHSWYYGEVFYGVVFGARYFFNDDVGVFFELGYNAMSVASVGLTFKF